MGFGLTLGKQVATTGANALSGGLVNGIMGLFGGNKRAEQRQYQHEKEMMALQNKLITGRCNSRPKIKSKNGKIRFIRKCRRC